jgi:hypothetical protein
MKKIFLLILLPVFSCAASTVEKNHPRPYLYEFFSTPHGNLILIGDWGKPSALASSVTLAGHEILSSVGLKDVWGAPERFMIPNTFSDTALELDQRFKPTDYPISIKRLVLAEGGDGTCFTQFTIIDFTTAKPFISDKFGYNPDGKSCLEFVRAKWGKKESYIYLKGPLKYVYYTGGKVIGPLE